MTSSPDLITAVSLGLMGSTHCIAMCGGITSALNIGLPKSSRRWPLIAGFHAGRILSYSAIGLLLGGLLTTVGDRIPALTLVLRWVAGMLLIAMGLYIANWWHGLSRLEQLGAPLWRRLQPMVNRLMPVTSVGRALALGGLWGWLPCGLIYSTLSWAITTEGAAGAALRMFCFGLGTLPAMLTLSLTADRGMRWLQRRETRQLIGLLLIGYGVWTLSTPLLHQFHQTTADHAGHHMH